MSFSALLTDRPQSANNVQSEEVEFVCKDFIPLAKNSYNLITGAGGTGKSFVGLHHAIWFAKKGMKALIWSTEDPAGVTKNRIERILLKMHNLSEKETHKIMDNIHIWGSDKIYRFAKNVSGVAQYNQDDVANLFTMLVEYEFALLDPLKAFHSVDENKNHEMDLVVRDIFQAGANIACCTLLVVHHTAKGESEDRMASRGASTIVDSCRFGLEVVPIRTEVISSGKKMMVKDPDFLQYLDVLPRKDNHFGARYFNGRYRFEIFPRQDHTSPKPIVVPYNIEEETLMLNNHEITDTVTISIADHNDEKNSHGFNKQEIKWDDLLDVVTMGKAYAPAGFIDGHRKNENYLGDTNVVFLDIDDGMTFIEAQTVFKDLQCFIFTTRSHQKDKKGKVCDRFRVAIKLDKPINLPVIDYKIAMQSIFDFFGNVDRATKDPARFYFSSPSDCDVWYSQGTEKLNWESLYKKQKSIRLIEDMKRREYADHNKPATSSDIETALYRIDPDCEYSMWVEIGMAIHSELGEGGMSVWDNWSRGGSKYNEREMETKWRSFKNGSGVSIGTLFHHAKNGSASDRVEAGMIL